MVVKSVFTATLLVLGMVFGGAVGAASNSPTEQVQTVVDEVISLLKDDSLSKQQRRDQIRATIAPHFDFEAMSQSILALNWKKANPEQRARFVELFQQLLENTYIVAMESYSGETVRYGKEKLDGQKASVETFIVRPTGVETPVVYKLKLNHDRWLAYDVIAEGISLIRNYRTSFRSIAGKDGMEGLLRQLESKVAEPT
jgi:phospholipid transport system substrate-binding protein